jgi:Dockerin type I domain
MKTLLASLFGIILATTSAQATFHLWQITQLYSDPTGTVQFIELTNGNFDGENLLMGHTITSNTNSYTFPNNLPFNTANHHFLIATPGYVAITGAPAPDYVLPSNNFFSVTSDTINYAGFNSLTFTAGQLPTDGVNSLNRAYNSTILFVAENSPTNFAGNAGNVSPPPPQSAFSRKVHGGAGTFDVPLPLTGNVGVECRTGGATNDYQMIINFATSVTVGNAVVTAGTGSVGSFSVSGSQVTVNLTGVTNIQRITVLLSNVNDGTHNGDTSVSMGVLVGDVNGNAAVNASDVSLTKSQVGQAVSGSNFREDVNVNGTISATDVAQVKAKVGTALPP